MIWKATKIVIKGWIQISIEAKIFLFFFLVWILQQVETKTGCQMSQEIFFSRHVSVQTQRTEEWNLQQEDMMGAWKMKDMCFSPCWDLSLKNKRYYAFNARQWTVLNSTVV